MNSIKQYIPRAIFYMDIMTPLSSFAKILFTNWKEDNSHLDAYVNRLKEKFNFPELFLVPHARIGLFHILKYLNLPEDSEILMTPVTLPEMLKMIRIHRLKPRFIGFKSGSFDLDLKNVTLTPRTKAILYTPLAGIHTDMEALANFCAENKLILIQDLTQSLGGSWKNRPLHTYGDYSFYSTCDLKTLHTHRGGFISTADPSFRPYYAQVRKDWFQKPSSRYFLNFIFEDFLSVLLLNRRIFNLFGVFILKTLNLFDQKLLESITAGHGIKIKSLHFLKGFMASGNDWRSDEIPVEQKYRFTSLQAKIGIRRLEAFDQIESERKRKILLFYSRLDLRSKLKAPYIAEDGGHTFWRAPLICEDYLDFQKYMLKRNVDVARSNLPWLPDFFDDTSVSGQEMKKNCVNIPIYHYLTDDEVLKIAEEVNRYAL